MDLAITQSTQNAEDMSWLGSAHGVEMGETIELDAAAFQTDFAALGYIPSGVVLAKRTADQIAVPYNPSGDDGSEHAVGHLLTSQPLRKTSGPIMGALFSRGRVRTVNLPADSGFDAAVKTQLPLIQYDGETVDVTPAPESGG